MIRGGNDKVVHLIYPQSVAASSTASGTFDAADYEFAQIDIMTGVAATNATEMVLGDGTATNSFTDIAAFTGDDTTNGFTIPAVDTSNGTVTRFNVDLRKRNRYLQLEVSPGATDLLCAIARLSRAHDVPDTDAEQGYDEVVNS